MCEGQQKIKFENSLIKMTGGRINVIHRNAHTWYASAHSPYEAMCTAISCCGWANVYLFYVHLRCYDKKSLCILAFIPYK